MSKQVRKGVVKGKPKPAPAETQEVTGQPTAEPGAAENVAKFSEALDAGIARIEEANRAAFGEAGPEKDLAAIEEASRGVAKGIPLKDLDWSEGQARVYISNELEIPTGMNLEGAFSLACHEQSRGKFAGQLVSFVFEGRRYSIQPA